MTIGIVGALMFLTGGGVLLFADAIWLRGIGGMICIAGFLTFALDIMRLSLRKSIEESRKDQDTFV